VNIGITCYPTYGGSGVVATELGLALAERGHEVHFITYDRPFRLTHFCERVYFHAVEMPNYPLFEFPMYTLALTSKLVEVTRDQGLDLLHMHYAIPHAMSAFLAREIIGRDRVRIVTTLHGTDSTLVGLEPSFLPLMQFALRQCDGVTAVSRYLGERTRSTYQVDVPIEHIPNFIDTAAYAPRDASKVRESFAPGGEKILVHTSNFRPVKRVQDVIRIFHQVQLDVPSRLLLVGDGPDRHDCEVLSRELGILDRVRFLGKMDALADILTAADLFLLPSQSESFGLSALEAMACGVPVISTSIGGIPEVNLHAVTGFIAEIGDVDRMARYAIDLLTDAKKYRRFSDAARSRAVGHFDKSAIVPMYEDYYRRVLDR
jgi:L-malate glycosyltransferase